MLGTNDTHCCWLGHCVILDDNEENCYDLLQMNIAPIGFLVACNLLVYKMFYALFCSVYLCEGTTI